MQTLEHAWNTYSYTEAHMYLYVHSSSMYKPMHACSPHAVYPHTGILMSQLDPLGFSPLPCSDLRSLSPQQTPVVTSIPPPKPLGVQDFSHQPPALCNNAWEIRPQASVRSLRNQRRRCPEVLGCCEPWFPPSSCQCPGRAHPISHGILS